MNVKPEIQFKSDALLSFFCLFWDVQRYPENGRDVLSSFNDERISKIADIKLYEKAKLYDLFQCMNPWQLKDGAQFSDLKPFLQKYMPEKGVVDLEQAFDGYRAFFKKNKPTVLENVAAMYREQESGMLQNLYKCFDVSTTQQMTCYLNPFPETVMCDGLCTGNLCVMNYGINPPNKQQLSFFENSTIQRRKGSTPIHEATHFIFNKSDLFDTLKRFDLSDSQHEGMWLILLDLQKKFKKYPQMDSRFERDWSLNAIHEGFASCSSALYRELHENKTTSKDNFYSGFQEANNLAFHMYPVFKEYVVSGKKFDDAFFKRVYQSGMNENAQANVLNIPSNKRNDCR